MLKTLHETIDDLRQIAVGLVDEGDDARRAALGRANLFFSRNWGRDEDALALCDCLDLSDRIEELCQRRHG